MIEIRTHGRGGQGSVIASEILADAFFHEGGDEVGAHIECRPAARTEEGPGVWVVGIAADVARHGCPCATSA